MSKRLLMSFTLSLAGLIGLGIFVATLFPANAPVANKAATAKTKQQKSAEPAVTTIIPGSYQPYSETSYENTAESRRVLFFHAPWCPQCRQLDKEISASSLPDGISILKVDYDTSQQLRAKYGVTLQTTFVEIDKDGNKIKSVVAYNDPTYENLSHSFSF